MARRRRIGPNFPATAAGGGVTGYASCFYAGTVMHRRVRPRKHRLSYRVFSMLLDLDELPRLDREVSGFGHNRWRPISFFDRDHGPGEAAPLKAWVERQLAAAGIDADGGPIRLLCYPRIFGYAFNPLSVYFCYRRSGELSAILYQVNNTFHQRHSYLIPVADPGAEVIRQSCGKNLYVSPFIEMAMTYHFRVRPPGETVAMAINETDCDGALLFASFSGTRIALSAQALRRLVASFPLLTLKVIGGIHWEALKLWLKGVPLVRRPPPPAEPVSVVRA
ncbi:MAG: DUF1365 domain-containing protein [Rhodospirillaceae bacterium]|nr:DUF1365 domain-containing protein [Rhodospirillaceae bacterium]